MDCRKKQPYYKKLFKERAERRKARVKLPAGEKAEVALAFAALRKTIGGNRQGRARTVLHDPKAPLYGGNRCTCVECRQRRSKERGTNEYPKVGHKNPPPKTKGAGGRS
jgi:hypothetical protein